MAVEYIGRKRGRPSEYASFKDIGHYATTTMYVSCVILLELWRLYDAAGGNLKDEPIHPSRAVDWVNDFIAVLADKGMDISYLHRGIPTIMSLRRYQINFPNKTTFIPTLDDWNNFAFEYLREEDHDKLITLATWRFFASAVYLRVLTTPRRVVIKDVPVIRKRGHLDVLYVHSPVCTLLTFNFVDVEANYEHGI